MKRWCWFALTSCLVGPLGLAQATTTLDPRATLDARAVGTLKSKMAVTRNLVNMVQGPKEVAIRLQDHLAVDNLGEFGISLQEIVSLSLEVYEDENRDSGIYYYRPSQYFLHWTPEDQYYLSVDYKPEQASDKNVVLDARLTPGSVADDVEVLKRLLQSYLRRQPQHLQPPNPEQILLLPLPARYEARFDWSAYGVGADDITVTGVDPDSRQFGIQVLTDVATKELLIGKLGDPSGLAGDVRIVPQQVSSVQPALAPFTVRARLKLADNEAYTRSPWRRGGGEHSRFQNERPLPVTLRYLVYLVELGGRLKLRGYDLGRQRLLPGDTAKLPNTMIGAEIGSPSAIRAWYSYTLDNDAEYRRALLADLTGGVGAIPVHDVEIQVVRPAELFEQYALFKVAVVVRSRFFDPRASSTGLIEREYELSPDVDRIAIAPLYRPADAGDDLYQYRIVAITSDGIPHHDRDWRRPTDGLASSIFIGSSQIDEVLAQ
jgi:hypothetical protein